MKRFVLFLALFSFVALPVISGCSAEKKPAASTEAKDKAGDAKDAPAKTEEKK